MAHARRSHFREPMSARRDHRRCSGLDEHADTAQLSWSLRLLPALNLADLDAAIWMLSPVFGLRPVRALRADTANVPKPEMFTLSPFRSAPTMSSKTVLTAR